ncbi:histidinol-phosphate/aromatic aminotransferase/cobyric acid decarboxylase-like protein [Nocardioides nitrophenolicus]|nr:Rv2231c family pyridoxal phosphate-dependent protein CobC [Nocardioides nitrophenolicus]MBM7519857.1 histidinol-phosphate/aromatic aminotransferase/cobyric acid decarboxylase-like protein [Nocardioides nitrophenolicus]
MVDLRHHGDVEARGMLDLAVNVYDGPRPPWLDDALRRSLDEVGAYPDPSAARSAVAAHHGRPEEGVLVTAGAAEAFTLVARLRAWRRPVVVHPQFTEPHAALEQAGHRVTSLLLREPFALDPSQVPEDADLVVIGNPTNPTGVLHPAALIRELRRPGRLVVVDEAFMDCVPGEPESLAGVSLDGVVVLRSLTKHWGIPGIRAGYVVGDPLVVAAMALAQTPWSVGTTAAAAVIACVSAEAAQEATRRAEQIRDWREHVEKGLADLGVHHLPSTASFVLARVGAGVHARLRDSGIAVRRADTFPGLDDSWIRIAVRPPDTTNELLRALRAMP